MILLKNFLNIFSISELRKKVFFTLGVLVIFRFGNHIPVIGLDLERLRQIIESTNVGSLLQYFDMFSGGSLSQGMLFAQGIGPYITASIMMQMLTLSIPSLELLAKEGEYGRKIINQYTRYLTLGVAILQSFGVSILMERYNLVIDPGWSFRLMFMLSLTVGSMIVMWLGEQISLFGIGNGSSMIIFAGIVSRLPDDVIKTITTVQEGLMDPLYAILLLAIFVGIAACIVFLERGERKIPVQYARRVIGQRMYGGQSTYIPFKINTAGVMPVIFSQAVLRIPVFIASLLATRFAILRWFSDSMARNGLMYNVLDFFLIVFFAYFYTALVFNPDELAENIKKGGGFIPGIRPGKKTSEFFAYLLNRIVLVGAIYLACLAILPNIILGIFSSTVTLYTLMSGTSLLIMVGVALEVGAQLESYLIEHRYEGFLLSGRMKGRSVR